MIINFNNIISKTHTKKHEPVQVDLKALLTIIEEYFNAAEQIEYYIKNDNKDSINKYNVHKDKVRELTMKVRSITREKKDLFFNKIIDY